ncbi:MAG: prepilin peptidase, partial [Ilumatobacteraceae bacterium]
MSVLAAVFVTVPVLALIGALVAIATAWPPASVAISLALAVLVLAAVVDVRERRLPDRIVLAASVLVAVAAVLGATSSAGFAAVLHVGAGVALAATPVGVVHLADPGAMGFGDVKTAAVLGGAVGLVDPRLALVAVSVAAGAAAATAAARRLPSIAFGPFLVLSTITV